MVNGMASGLLGNEVFTRTSYCKRINDWLQFSTKKVGKSQGPEDIVLGLTIIGSLYRHLAFLSLSGLHVAAKEPTATTPGLKFIENNVNLQ